MRFSIRKKLILIILIFVSVPIGFLGSHLFQMTTRALEDRIGQTARIQASAVIDQIDRLLFERYQNIKSWSEEEMMLDILSDDPEARISHFLTTLKKQYGLYEMILCTDNSGKVIAASNPQWIGKNAREELWFKKAVGGEIQASVETGSNLFNGYGTVFAAPVFTETILKQVKSAADEGSKRASMITALEAWKPNTLGTIAAWVNWSEIIEAVNSITIMEGQKQSREAYAALVNREGVLITQPYFEERAVMFRENLRKAGIKAAKQASEGNSGFTVETGRYDKKDFIGYAASGGYRDFKGFGWAALVFQDAAAALKPLRSMKYQVIGVAALVIFTAGLVALLLATGISRPIEKLADFMRIVGSGDFSGTVSVQSNDEVGTLAASFNDMITNLRKAKNELTDARDFTENIIQSMADMLVVLDVEGRVKSSNPAVKTILGYEEKEIRGLSFPYLLSGELRKDQPLLDRIQRGDAISMELEYKAKNGAEIPVLFSSASLKDHFGKFQGVVLIARDMREYKSLQNKFLEAQKMDAIGRLAGGVAHDFNNMLTVINGYSEDILSGRGKAETVPRKVGEILKAGRRATKLVSQLLTFSRRQTSKPVVLDPNSVIQGLDKMLRLVTGARIQLVMLPDQNLWPIKVDSGQFEQVVTNLCVNARDAMPNGGKLIIKSYNAKVNEAQAAVNTIVSGDYAVVEVQDTGSGMTEEVKKRIFEPFFTTKPKGKGTGLGLATCFDFIKESHGFIEVETELGKGTFFKLYFPKAEGKPQNVLEQDLPQDLPHGNEAVLLVEDEDLVREFTQRMLASHGYRVITAANGETALKTLEEYHGEKIQVLLTDIVLPDTDGRDLAERILRKIPDIRIIFMSGYVEEDDFEEKGIVKQNVFLQKPVMAGALLVKLREVIERPGLS